jgi:hypothetical protein
MEELKIYPRSSAFEALLAKVYIELWELQDYPSAFSKRVHTFVYFFCPSQIQDKIAEKYPDFDKDVDALMLRLGELEGVKRSVDALDASAIDNVIAPGEEQELALKVWHGVVDALTDMGFNFPRAMEKSARRMT